MIDVSAVSLPLADTIDAKRWKGRVLSIHDAGPEQLPYFIFQPTSPKAGLAPVVSIHGWTRNAAEHAFRLASLAETKGVTVIAPLYSRKEHKHYQRLEIRKGERCPAEALENLLRDAQQRFNIDTRTINLFGFSGGAQFAHRFGMMRPHLVNRMALMAAGWFTMPDIDVPYPLGIAPSEILADRTFDLASFFGCPTRVFVGERDLRRDDSLKTGKQIDRMQGRNRVERAQRWVTAMQKYAGDHKVKADIELQIINRAKHNFGASIRKHQLDELVFNWLIPDQKGEKS
ncbi:MAG: PHB depolymerase family esterase [Parasphingorhabdus sp.]|uniref:alpha/beta hydrolase n=1 Tax=Parasphingorhabdus sp. TaxID=2709688 RepID=UPI00300257FF